MVVSDENKQKIKQALTDYLAGAPQPAFDYDLRDIAAKMQAVPMMSDWGGHFAIRLDGEIVSIDGSEPDKVQIESDPRTIRIVLYQGSLKHPILANLVPERPSDAISCAKCEGSGRCVPLQPSFLDAFVCYCGGLGWLLPSD
jgi:hypothetical protein